MKTIKLFGLPILLFGFLIISTIPFQSCEPDDDEDDDVNCDTCHMVYKPNIYIYPKEITQLFVNIDFPIGGEIITSIPEYGTGWDVTVDTNGLIDNKYNYLFYESIQPDVWQLNEGWIVKRSDLKDFFDENMSNSGFFGEEIQDFTDYWIPRLTDSEYYALYPQNSMIIESVIALSFSKEPDNLLRLFYVVKGVNTMPSSKLTEPKIDKLFDRKGFFVVEWGVILK